MLSPLWPSGWLLLSLAWQTQTSMSFSGVPGAVAVTKTLKILMRRKPPIWDPVVLILSATVSVTLDKYAVLSGTQFLHQSNQGIDLEGPPRSLRNTQKKDDSAIPGPPKISILNLKFIFCLLPYRWLAYSCCNLFNWAMLSSLELSLHESLSIKSS